MDGGDEPQTAATRLNSLAYRTPSTTSLIGSLSRSFYGRFLSWSTIFLDILFPIREAPKDEADLLNHIQNSAEQAGRLAIDVLEDRIDRMDSDRNLPRHLDQLLKMGIRSHIRSICTAFPPENIDYFITNGFALVVPSPNGPNKYMLKEPLAAQSVMSWLYKHPYRYQRILGEMLLATQDDRSGSAFGYISEVYFAAGSLFPFRHLLAASG
ncbi:hypothetical protein GQ53DRAFT_819259 [Thozetella sp. PMI_491]|nr:hypothetical protein GQ53DRAFT_819259 [Thozetella sp. PMI_491]